MSGQCSSVRVMHVQVGVRCDVNRGLSFEMRKMGEPRQIIGAAVTSYFWHKFAFI